MNYFKDKLRFTALDKHKLHPYSDLHTGLSIFRYPIYFEYNSCFLILFFQVIGML